MTVSKIAMQPDNMRIKARELEKMRQQQLNLMRKMRILMQSLSDVWQGEAQEALTQRFMNSNQTVNELSAALEEYIQIVRYAASEAENTERLLQDKAKKL